MAQAARESQTALYVARQPILDEHGRVFGYELLYRGAADDTACVERAEVASASVITSAILDLGLETLTDGRLAFLNVTDSLVIDQIDALVGPNDVVLELLESAGIFGIKTTLDDVLRVATANFTATIAASQISKVDASNAKGASWRKTSEGPSVA